MSDRPPHESDRSDEPDEPDDAGGRPAVDNLDPGYSIGRGRPPIATQFKKGQSGNPRGRPRKPPGETDLATAAINDLILGEAQRLITVTEGGRHVTLSTGQAIVKATIAGAGKGNAQSQRTFLHYAVNAQAQRDKARAEILAASYSIKLHLEQLRRRWVAQGGKEIDLDPHPSDIEINWETGEVKVYLVLMREEHDARAKLINLRDEQQAILKRAAATIAEDGDDYLLQLGRELAREKINMTNEYLAPRFREEPYRSPGNLEH